MKYLDLLTISRIINGVLFGNNIYIYNISIDTRDLKIRNSLFIFIKGNYKEDFLCFNAIKNGALALLINNFNKNYNVPQIIVKDTKLSLGLICKWLRKKSIAKVISITGSTGKTSVKEIISNILIQSGRTLFNYYNFNNDLGVPITLLNLQYNKYKYIVLELGSNKLGDIDYLSNIVSPNISCITNISISHLKGFKKFINIIIDKGKIFKYLSNNGYAFININHNYINYWYKYLLNKKIIFYSLFKCFYTNVYITNINIDIYGSNFILHTYYGSINIFLKLLGIHNIINSILSISLSLLLGISLKDIKVGLESCLPIKGRLYPIYFKNKKIILDDSYNCNPRSLYYSLLFLSQCNGYKLLIISDMSELSYMSEFYHKYIGLLIKNFFKINKVLSIGKYSYLISKYSLIGEHFNNLNSLLLRFKYIFKIVDNLIVLIKGSRIFNMDKIINFM